MNYEHLNLLNQFWDSIGSKLYVIARIFSTYCLLCKYSSWGVKVGHEKPCSIKNYVFMLYSTRWKLFIGCSPILNKILIRKWQKRKGPYEITYLFILVTSKFICHALIMREVPPKRQNCGFDPSWRESLIKSSLACHVLEPMLKVGWNSLHLHLPSQESWETFAIWNRFFPLVCPWDPPP